MQLVILDIIKVFQPITSLFISILIPVFMTKISNSLLSFLRVTDKAKQLEIESMLRTALHNCATNAVHFAMTRLSTLQLTPEVVNLAKDYMRSKSPNTLAQLNMNDQAITDIILSKGIILQGKTSLSNRDQ